MASMRDIQRRRSSVSSIGQITKAMKLVSTVKLQKTRTRAEQAKPYFNMMYETVTNILSRSGQISHPFSPENPETNASLSLPPTEVWQAVTIPTSISW